MLWVVRMWHNSPVIPDRDVPLMNPTHSQIRTLNAASMRGFSMVKIGDIENLPEILRPPPITEMHINMCGHSSTSTMMNIFSADGSIRADQGQEL